MTADVAEGAVTAARRTVRVLEHGWGRVLSAAPLIVTATTEGKELPIGTAPMLSPGIGDRPAHFLTRLAWEVETPWRLERLVLAHRAHAARHPRHVVVFLANTPRETALLRAAGVPSHLCNHNAFADETVFTPGDGSGQVFDAIYNARMKPYKRHALAAGVPSLALLYGEVLPEHARYFDDVRRTLPRATLVNAMEVERSVEAIGDPRRRRAMALLLRNRGVALKAPEVAGWLRRARVGLCLSASEGAMVASVEYMLCGLPIVSTRSIGGRDQYFEPDHTAIVPDDPAAVAEAVQVMAARSIDPHAIRAAALAKVRAGRRVFIDLVQSIIDAAGGRDDFAARFPALQAAGMFRLRMVREIAAEIASEVAGR